MAVAPHVAEVRGDEGLLLQHHLRLVLAVANCKSQLASTYRGAQALHVAPTQCETARANTAAVGARVPGDADAFNEVRAAGEAGAVARACVEWSAGTKRALQSATNRSMDRSCSGRS
jgi:hypothetical protein